jgi:hypothetical protein
MSAQSVAQLVWQGCVPVCVKCASAQSESPAFFSLALRCASLLHLAAAAVAHFDVDVSGNSLAWFEYDGVSLPPLPAGVLVDVLRPPLPWCITLHLDKLAASPPHATFVQANEARVRALFVNSLKEACFLACGSSSPLLTCQSADFDGIANCTAASVDTLPAALRSGPGCALRLYLVPSARCTTWSDVVTSSHAVRDASATLRDFIGAVIQLYASNDKAPAVTVQGIAMEGLIDVPVVSLHRLLAAPDHFLHVVVALGGL